MRRMMHAIVLPLIFTPVLNAQDLLGVAVHEPPPPVVATHEAVPIAGYQTEFYPIGGEQPYSPLAVYMSCNDNCKDFWAGYSAERAAIASRLCNECSHRHGKGCHSCYGGCSSHACGPASNVSANCQSGNCNSRIGASCDAHASNQTANPSSIATNRYKPGWSTLYRDPAPSFETMHRQGPSSVVMVKRAIPAQSQPTPAKMSLLVSKQSLSAQGNGGALPRPIYNDESNPRPAISPYLKSSNKTPIAGPAIGTPADSNSGSVTYRSATLPPSGGTWAR